MSIMQKKPHFPYLFASFLFGLFIAFAVSPAQIPSQPVSMSGFAKIYPTYYGSISSVDELDTIEENAGHFTAYSAVLYESEIYSLYYTITNNLERNLTVYDKGVYCWWGDFPGNYTPLPPTAFSIGPKTTEYYATQCQAPDDIGNYVIEGEVISDVGNFTYEIINVSVIPR